MKDTINSMKNQWEIGINTLNEKLNDFQTIITNFISFFS